MFRACAGPRSPPSPRPSPCSPATSTRRRLPRHLRSQPRPRRQRQRHRHQRHRGHRHGRPAEFLARRGLCAPTPTRPRVIYFDLQRRQGPREATIFRLPYPADARRKGGGIDLEGFPRAAAEFAPAPELGAVVDRWLAHVEQDTPGFALAGAVLFRSSVASGTIKGITLSSTSPRVIHNYGEDDLRAMSYDRPERRPERQHYICTNWLAVDAGRRRDPARARHHLRGRPSSTPPSRQGRRGFRQGRRPPGHVQSATTPTDSSQASAWHDLRAAARVHRPPPTARPR
jgi:hypothetical protein